jgi:hypothetical protein
MLTPVPPKAPPPPPFGLELRPQPVAAALAATTLGPPARRAAVASSSMPSPRASAYAPSGVTALHAIHCGPACRCLTHTPSPASHSRPSRTCPNAAGHRPVRIPPPTPPPGLTPSTMTAARSSSIHQRCHQRQTGPGCQLPPPGATGSLHHTHIGIFLSSFTAILMHIFNACCETNIICPELYCCSFST